MYGANMVVRDLRVKTFSYTDETLDELEDADGLGPEGLTPKHLPVFGRDLVRKRSDPRGVDRDVGMEEVREPDRVETDAVAHPGRAARMVARAAENA